MDKQRTLRIEEIFQPSSQVGKDYYCENFIIFPDGKERFGGHILGIIEINATPTAHAQKIVQTIISSLKDHYYRQVITSPEPQKLNLETIFEHALQKTNEQVLQLIQNGQIQLVLENINFLISVVNAQESDSDIFFTHRGNIQSFLIHKTKQANHKIINIISNSASEQSNKVKIFSSIISGKIFLPDTLIITNEGFARFFPAEKINQMVTNRPIKEILEDFKILLHKRPQNYQKAYSAIVIKQEELQFIEKGMASQKSIDKLVSTQQDTEKFLTPVATINIKSKIKNIFATISGIFTKRQKPKGIIIEEIRASDSAIKKILKKFNFFKRAKPKNIDKERENPETEPKLRPKSKKIIFASIFALIVVFALSIVWIYNKQQSNKDTQAYEQTIQVVENKLNQAEASFLFRNTQKSLTLLNEAKNLMANLPQKTEEQKQKYQKIEQSYQALQNKLLKLETVQAQQITAINAVSSAAQIAILDKNLIIGDSNTLNILDLTTKQVSNSINTGIQADIKSAVAFSDDSMFILYENNQLYQYSAENEDFSKIDISEKGSWIDFKVYNSHLYFLDAQNNQINKLRNVGSTSFGPPADWINDTVNFANANSLAIDGNIYVLSSNGTIQKFLSGDKQAFSMQKIEPALQNTSEIYTNVDSGFIYLLDKPTKRIIVLNKQGLIVVQYQVENVERIDDMAVDEKSKTIYIIDGQKIWSVRMKHL